MEVQPRGESLALYRYRFGTAEFDEARFELKVGGQPVEVQRRPLEVLALLLRRAGEVVTREELQKAVWDNRPTVDNVIDTALTKLRGALKEDNAARLLTQPRVGYRLIGPVERLAVGRHFTMGLSLEAGTSVARRENFVLVLRLGQSPHHEVWLARHSKTGEQRVYKFSADGEGLAALKREATLARVLCESLGQRADFVRMLDWNFDAQPFFLECEYAGANLIEWAAGHLAGLMAGERLELFLQVAEAVAAAHSVGVLHKDLKPANLLVSERAHGGWQLRVTDFGSARLLEPDRLQRFGITQLGLTLTQGVISDVGGATPQYVAPERLAGGAATVQSDVFALGILLYQLVVGDMRRPLVSGWERDITNELLREDIAAATDGDPALRIASVEELIRRLRHLDERRERKHQEAIARERAARTEQELLRARARRPWLIAALVSLTLGLVSVSWVLGSLSRAHRETEAARQRAEVIASFLNDDVLGAGDPSAPGVTRETSIREALARAERRLDDRFTGDPITRASIELALGRAYFGQNDYTKAAGLEQAAVAVLQRRLGPRDGTTLEAEYYLVQALDMLARYAEAQVLLARADHDAGARIHTPSQLALLALWTRGGAALLQMRPERALAAYEEAERVRAIVAPADVTWLIRIRGDLAWCDVRLNRSAAAISVVSPLMDAFYSPERVGAQDWTKAHLQYGLALGKLGRLAEAQGVIRDVISQSARVVGADSYLTGLAWNHLSAVDQVAGHWTEAIDAEEHSYSIVHKALGDRAQATLAEQATLGALDYLSGDLSSALAKLEGVQPTLVSVLGPAAPFTQMADFYLSEVLYQQGKAREALSLTSGLEPAALTAADESGHWSARLQGLKGQILLTLGDEAAGGALLRAAVGSLEREHAPDWIIAPLQQSLAQQSLAEVRIPKH
ncbi:MAG TPA: winged helix-turn-helix domain-containing protein [Steroidobacteraceae bacterium]|nr:winged helix-turn-helix domain-containing protein [Steroidobacteraceae bacterium]